MNALIKLKIYSVRLNRIYYYTEIIYACSIYNKQFILLRVDYINRNHSFLYKAINTEMVLYANIGVINRNSTILTR